MGLKDLIKQAGLLKLAEMGVDPNQQQVQQVPQQVQQQAPAQQVQQVPQQVQQQAPTQQQLQDPLVDIVGQLNMLMNVLNQYMQARNPVPQQVQGQVPQQQAPAQGQTVQ